MKSNWAFLLLTAFFSIILGDLANAQTYKGQVIDEFTREPVPYVTVSLQNEKNEHIRHTSTDENGYYLLKAPEPSDYYLHIKRIGYSENTGGPFFVENDDTLNVKFRVMEVSKTLDEITVEGFSYEDMLIQNYLESKNFYTRKKHGIGQFFTRKDLEEKKLINVSDIFRYAHGIQRLRRSCTPNLILDGMSMGPEPSLMLIGNAGKAHEPSVDIDMYTSVERLAGIEIYPSIVGQPAMFGPTSHCGAIILWTR